MFGFFFLGLNKQQKYAMSYYCKTNLVPIKKSPIVNVKLKSCIYGTTYGIKKALIS